MNLRSLLQSYVEQVWREQNPAAVDDFLAPTYRRYLGATAEPLSREGQKKLLTEFRAAFPDAELRIEDVIVENDLVAFRSTILATHRGDFRGIPPRGKRVEIQLLDMIRVKNGRFVEQWGGPDLLDLLQQLEASVSADDAET